MRDLRLILNFRTILFCTGIFWDWKEAQAIVPYVLIYFSPWNIYSINWLLLKPWKLYGTLFLLESIYVALCSFSLVTGEWLCIFLIRQYYRILVPRHIPCIAKDKVRAELLVCEWYKYLRCIWTFLFLEFLKPLYLFQKGKRAKGVNKRSILLQIWKFKLCAQFAAWYYKMLLSWFSF